MGGPSMEEEYVVKIKTRKPDELIGKINLLLSDYLPLIYKYNNLVKNKNYYLKPVHIVIKKKSNGERIKYYYYGRYWYRIEKKGNERKGIKWVYLGKEKPEKNLPDPPPNPLEGLVIKFSGDEVSVITARKDMYMMINNVLSSLKISSTSSPAHK